MNPPAPSHCGRPARAPNGFARAKRPATGPLPAAVRNRHSGGGRGGV